ncbi:MAG: hypothetical protein AB7N91_24990 [Candidatus Tectimicrobiota bacterium]
MIRYFEPSQLPKVQRWLAGQGEGVWDFLSICGGAELAIAFSTLYWPEFIDVEGCVLLRERYEAANFQEWWEKLNGDMSKIEAVINHVHLWDLFVLDENVPDKALEDLARILALCWRCALQEQFPKRIFDVHVVADDTEYGPTISFSTIR